MIELAQIIDVAKRSEASPLPLELVSSPPVMAGVESPLEATVVIPSENWRLVTASYFRRLLRLHTQEQREAANLFIKAMQDAHPNAVAINRIFQSEKIKPHKPITAKQALRAYQKFELLEETSYQFVDDGSGKNHKKLKFMHGLVLKLKTFFS